LPISGRFIGFQWTKNIEGKTFEELTTCFWDESSLTHQPSWSISIPRSWKEIQSSDKHFWEAIIESDIYTFACVHTTPAREKMQERSH
jgi:hypothetical protein